MIAKALIWLVLGVLLSGPGAGAELSGASPSGAPASAPTWRHLGLGVATVTTLAVDPHQPRRLYAGGYTGLDLGADFFRSADGGATWILGRARQINPTILDLVVARHDPRILYASDSGVFKSTDGGATWAERSAGLPPVATRDLALDAAHPGTLYVAHSYDGVFRSTDGAATWERLALPGHPCDFGPVAVAATAPPTVYASGGCAIIQSRDGGDSWRVLAGSPMDIGTIAVDPADPTHVLVGGPGAGVWQTRDGGATWRYVLSSRGDAIAFDPDHPRLVFAAGWPDRLDWSRDGGATWSAFGQPLPTHDVRTALVVGGMLLLGGKGGIWRIDVPAEARGLPALPRSGGGGGAAVADRPTAPGA
jgi:photosystem II stability/assembly factor-like uncharacterized protein